MDLTVKKFYDYVHDTFDIETVYYWAIDALRDITDELRANPLSNKPTQDYLDGVLSSTVNVKVKSSSIGITDFDSTIVKTTHPFCEFGTQQNSVSYALSYEMLKNQVLQFTANKLKKVKEDFLSSGVRIPDYIMDVFKEVDRSCSASLQREFCSRIEVSENAKDLLDACDVMKKTLADKAAKSRLDEEKERKRRLTLIASLFLIGGILNNSDRR